MASSELDFQLQRLVTGLSDQEIKKGVIFQYDGGELYADEVATIMLPSILCLANELSCRCGMGGLGYRFYLAEANPIFPLHAQDDNQDDRGFFESAPFVTDVFENQFLGCSSDLSRFFERAAVLVQPGFSLRHHTSYLSLSS